MERIPPTCIGLLAVAANLLAGCRGEPEEVVIGYALPGWGRATAEFVEWELARDTGRPGPPVRLVYSTLITGSPVDEHLAGAEALVATPGVVAVVGHGGSRESLVGSAVYGEAGIVQIVPTGTSRRLAEAGPWTFALPANDSVQGAFIADHVWTVLGARTALVFYVNDEYGDGLREGVTGELHARGGRVLQAVAVDPGSGHAAIVEAALARSLPDVVVVAARSRSTGAIAQAMHALAPGIPIVAGDGALELPELELRAGPAVQQLRVVAFWTAGDGTEASRAFADRFFEVTGVRPHASHAMAYDALRVLVAAMETGARRPAEIRRFLLELGESRPPFQGVTGTIAFGPHRVPQYRMVRIVEGRAVPLGPAPSAP